jgi:hypothetical protein
MEVVSHEIHRFSNLSAYNMHEKRIFEYLPRIPFAIFFVLLFPVPCKVLADLKEK